MRRLLPMALLAAAVFGTDAEAAVRVYRPTEPSQVVLQLGSSAGESQHRMMSMRRCVMSTR